jgi:hypothetical protein
MRRVRPQNKPRDGRQNQKSARRILFTLKVFGLKIPVIHTPIEPQFSGKFDPVKCEIYINTNVTKKDINQVILHEVIHAILFRTGMWQTHGLSYDLQEVICENIGTALDEMRVTFVNRK